MANYCQSAIILALLAVFAPVSFYICLWSWLIVKFTPKTSRRQKQRKPCIVILNGNTSTALHITRLFHAEGFRIIVCGTKYGIINPCAWSTYCDRYYRIPDPVKEPNKYIKHVCDIVASITASLLVPMDPRHVDMDTHVLSQLGDSVVSLSFDAISFQELNNKATFMECLKKINLPCPNSYIITDSQQVRDIVKSTNKPYILKSILSGTQQSLYDVIPNNDFALNNFLTFKSINPSCPLILQEKLELPVYSTCSLLVNSNVIAQTNSIRSVEKSEILQHIDSMELQEWVQQFVARYPRPLTGWLSLDFMRSAADGQIYPLKCRPRILPQYILYSEEDGTLKEFLKRLQSQTNNLGKLRPARKLPISPKRKQAYWFMNEMYNVLINLCKPKILMQHLKIILRGKEVVFRFADPLPYFVHNFIHLPWVLLTDSSFERHQLSGVNVS